MKKSALLITTVLYALLYIPTASACSLVDDFVKMGGQHVTVGYMNSLNYWMQSFPGATIHVYQPGTTTPQTIYTNSACSITKTQPFFADNVSHFTFYTSASQVDVVFSGSGLAASLRITYNPTPVQASYLTQAQADTLYLKLDATNSPLTGPLSITNGLTVSSPSSFGGLLSTTGIVDASGGGGIIARTGIGGVTVNPVSGTNASFWATTPTQNWRMGMEGGNNFILYNGTASTTPLTINASTGLATLNGGLTVASGTTTLGPLVATSVSGTTGGFSGAISSTAGTFSGLITANAGLTVASGTTTTGATNTGALNSTTGVFSSTLQATGLATLNGGVLTNNGAGNFGTGTVTGGVGAFTGNPAGQPDFSVTGNKASIVQSLIRNTNGGSGAALLIQTAGADQNAYVQHSSATQGWITGMSGSTNYILYDSTNSKTAINVAPNTENVTFGSGLTSQVGIGQAPAVRLHVGQGGTGTQSEEVRIDSGSGAGGDAQFTFYRNGSNKGKIGISGSAGNIITGSAINDLNEVNAQKINWSAAGSAAIQMSLNASGQLAVGATTASFPLHVQSTSTPQTIAEYDGTHRTGLWHDATNGYSGTTTNTPYILRTNNTDAITISTAQNANFAGKVGLSDSSGTYPFSIKRAGVVAGGEFVSGVITDNGGSKGLALGYEAGGAGVIGDIFAGGLQFMTNGTSRIIISGSGAVGFSNSSKLTLYGGNNLAGNGIPVIAGKVDLSAQAASIGSTTITTSGATISAQLLHICWVQTITRAASTSSSLLTTISWTDDSATTHSSTYWQDAAAGATGTTADASNTLGSSRGNCFNVSPQLLSNISYATTYATSGATSMQYSIKVYAQTVQ